MTINRPRRKVSQDDFVNSERDSIPPGAESITCPDCGMTSYNPNDIKEGYCGNCHDWTSVGTDGVA